MIQRLIWFFLSVFILAYSHSLSSQEVSHSTRSPLSIELYYVMPTENYLQSSLGGIDYSMVIDLIKNPENLTEYPFNDYTDNFISETKSTFGFELGTGLIPKFPNWRSGVFYPEVKLRVGYYRNNFSYFGHYENTSLSGDTIQKESIYYLHYFDYLVASGDFVVHYKVLNWLSIYSGLGIMAGISTRSKIDESITSYKYLDSDDFSIRIDPIETKNTYKGKQLFRAGFNIPIGLRIAVYKQVALQLEYKWGLFYQFVLDGDIYPKRMNNFAVGIQYTFHK